MEKRCNKCKEVKDIEQFYKDSYRIDGHDYKCKKCTNVKFSSSLYKQKARNKSMKYLYNLTEDDIGIKLQNQGGKCMICDKPISRSNRTAHVDHCHDTKVIRGILCPSCNTRVGQIESKKPWLNKVNKYISKFAK